VNNNAADDSQVQSLAKKDAAAFDAEEEEAMMIPSKVPTPDLGTCDELLQRVHSLLMGSGLCCFLIFLTTVSGMVCCATERFDSNPFLRIDWDEELTVAFVGNARCCSAFRCSVVGEAHHWSASAVAASSFAADATERDFHGGSSPPLALAKRNGFSLPLLLPPLPLPLLLPLLPPPPRCRHDWHGIVLRRGRRTGMGTTTMRS
jgi:hypothetical protein